MGVKEMGANGLRRVVAVSIKLEKQKGDPQKYRRGIRLVRYQSLANVHGQNRPF